MDWLRRLPALWKIRGELFGGHVRQWPAYLLPVVFWRPVLVLADAAGVRFLVSAPVFLFSDGRTGRPSFGSFGPGCPVLDLWGVG